MNIETVLLYALATYYLSVTLTKLHGPLGLAERLRHAVYRARGLRQGAGDIWLLPGSAAPGGDRVLGVEDDWVATGVSCPFCASLYVAALLVALLALMPGATPLIQVLAVAGASSVLFSLGRHW